MNLNKPPKKIPEDLIDKFTQNGAIEIGYMYLDGINDHNYVYKEWNCLEIENMIYNAKTQMIYRGYEGVDKSLYLALNKYKIDNQTVLIVGSSNPWYESIAIANGAKECIVIEYKKLHYFHPKIKVFSHGEYNSSPIICDVGFSISSIEHDGLGRYGDPISPTGDLDSMLKLKKMIKKGGILFLSIPIGKDKIIWNAHRIYGEIRLPQLLEGWKMLESFNEFTNEKLDIDCGLDARYHPIFVLENE